MAAAGHRPRDFNSVSQGQLRPPAYDWKLYFGEGQSKPPASGTDWKLQFGQAQSRPPASGVDWDIRPIVYEKEVMVLKADICESTAMFLAKAGHTLEFMVCF
jgi:hypothetical protein